MTRMRFKDEPNLATFGDAEGVAGGERELDEELDVRVGSGLHTSEDDDVAAFHGHNFSRKDIARANLIGLACGQENVARADGDAESATCGGANEWGFENERGVFGNSEVRGGHVASRYFVRGYLASRYLGGRNFVGRCFAASRRFASHGFASH